MKRLLLCSLLLVSGIVLKCSAQDQPMVADDSGLLPRPVLCPPPRTFWDPFQGVCRCDPRIVCASKLYKVNKDTCLCDLCKDECASPMCQTPHAWNNKTCSCECERKAKCPFSQYWDYDACECKCMKKETSCCGTRIWDKSTCECRCPEPASCSLPRVWNDEICSCECDLNQMRRCIRNRDYQWDPNTCTCSCAPNLERMCIFEQTNHIFYNYPQCMCDCDPEAETRCRRLPGPHVWHSWPECGCGCAHECRRNFQLDTETCKCFCNVTTCPLNTVLNERDCSCDPIKPCPGVVCGRTMPWLNTETCECGCDPKWTCPAPYVIGVVNGACKCMCDPKLREECKAKFAYPLLCSSKCTCGCDIKVGELECKSVGLAFDADTCQCWGR